MEIFNLHCGDCLEIMPTIQSGSVDMILCDLPYGTTACKWDAIIPFEPLWEEYERIIKVNGAIVLTANQPFTSALVMSNPKLFRYELIWTKNKGSNPLLAKKRPLPAHESVLVFYKKMPVYNPQFREGTPYKAPRTGGTHSSNTLGKVGSDKFKQKDNEGFRYPLSVMEYNMHCGSKMHPTQKPVPLMEYLIRTYTNPGEVILDNCMGSGTTGMACLNTQRYFIGIEKDEKIFRLAKERIENTPILEFD